MHIIGLTGGIASGKSTVSKILQDLGACIIDADKIARQIVEPGQPALSEIQAAFGSGILLADGTLDRKILGEIVFNNPTARQRLNTITHDRIKLAINEAVEKAAAAGYNIVVLDVPLLLEVGWQHLADTVWVVYIDRETQIARVIERDGLTGTEAMARIQSQMSLDDKKAYADTVIDNSGSLAETRRQVAEALAAIQKAAR